MNQTLTGHVLSAQIIDRVLMGLNWVQTPAASAVAAGSAIFIWAIVRFSHTLRNWLVSGLKRLFWLIVEFLFLSWGIITICLVAWRYGAQVLAEKAIWGKAADGLLLFGLVAIISFTAGVILSLTAFRSKSGSIGSGAGKSLQNAKGNSLKPQNQRFIGGSSLVNLTADQNIDEVAQTLFPNELRVRINQLEELMRILVSKFADMPSIDLIAASFQDIQENTTTGTFDVASNQHVRPPIVASVTSVLPEGNPLLDTPNSSCGAERLPSTAVFHPQENKNDNSGQCSNATPAETVSQRLPTAVMTESMLSEFVGVNKEDFFKKVSQLAREERESKRKPNELTEEEKNLGKESLKELDLKWIRESFRQIKPAHHQDIGALTEEESKFSRNSIKELIRQRRHDNWVKNMRKKGVVLFVCPTCNTTTTEGHRCFATAWNAKIKRGPLMGAKEVLVTQQGRGAIKLQEQMRIDQEHLGKSYQKLHEKKHLLSAQEKQAEALRLNLPLSLEKQSSRNEPTADYSMEQPTTMDVSAVVVEQRPSILTRNASNHYQESNRDTLNSCHGAKNKVEGENVHQFQNFRHVCNCLACGFIDSAKVSAGL